VSYNPKKNKSSLLLGKAIALTGIAAEMGIIIFLAAKGGMWLDQYFGNDKRIFTAVATLAGVGASLWLVLIQLKRIQNK
jgi:hypothetical protein